MAEDLKHFQDTDDYPNELIAPNGRMLIKFIALKRGEMTPPILQPRSRQRNPAGPYILAPEHMVEPGRIKKDALYKPILRKFRGFLREQLNIMGLGKNYGSSWSPVLTRKKIWRLMFELKLPEAFMNLKCLNMMILFIFPSVAKRKNEFCRDLQLYFNEIRTISYDVFKENNIRKRA